VTVAAPSQRVPRSPSGYIRWLAGQVGRSGLGPVMILLAAASIERFGNQALTVLLPDIRDTFHLTNQQAITTVTVASVLPALLSPFAGFVSDRMDRVRLSQWGTAAVGIVAVGLGLAPRYWLFLVLAVLAGIGLLVNFPAHSSLITDYYPPESLGITFTLYLFAVSAAALLGSPLAGGVAAGIGWRGAFLLLGVPAVIGVWLLGRLRDPGRGASLGMALEREERSSFWEGFRRVKAVRSLRRTWWAAAFFGGGVIAFNLLQSVFFKDVYHYNSLARGVVIALFGLGGLVGTVLGGWIVQVGMRRGRPELLPVINGLMVVEFGVGIVLMGVLPWSIGSAAMLFVLGIGASGFNPAYNVMIGLVTTPRLRGQAFSYSLIWVTLGALVVAPVIGGIANHHQRAAAYVLGILVVGAGLVELTARQFVARDVAEARKVQAAADVDALLSVRGLEVAYAGNLQILFGVDLDVRQGEVVALLGTNGAGKSTFLRAVSGLVDPVGGAVFFNGRDVTHADSVNKAVLGMALVPGDRGVFPGLTVADNLRIAGWMFRSESAQFREATERVLDYFPVLRERWDVPAGNLSGGEQQMVVLAQALMGRPRLLMIDELSLGLAPIVVEQLLGTVRQLARDGTTILLVEQSVNVALTVAERAVFMEKGEIRFSGRTEELLERPDVLRAVFLEGASEAMAGSRSGARTRAREQGAGAAGNGAGPRPVLEVEAVTKRFGGVVANEDVSMTLHQGQILGLLGPNGAGKTTLFDLISGFFPLDSGRILLHGLDISHLAPDSRARLGLGRSFQDSKLFPAMTVTDTIKVGLERHVEVRDPLAAALSLPATLDSEAAVAERAGELVEMLGLDAYRNKFVAEISTGTRRLIDLACILAHEPSVILFDEPSSGIAQRESEALGPMLRKVRELTGSSLLVIEHDMPLLTGLADEVVALDLGRVLAQGPPDEIVNDPRVVAAYLGTGSDAVSRSGGLPVRRRGTRARTARTGAASRRRVATKDADEATDRPTETGPAETGETP
jgi:ABC-type branched-subunit amino acid transport system ATPase component/predicted MFS family arabinose efflux permease